MEGSGPMALNITMVPHRVALPAHNPDASLFVALEVSGNRTGDESGIDSPPSAAGPVTVGWIILVDTSGSMRVLTLGQTEAEFALAQSTPDPRNNRLEVVIDALNSLVTSEHFHPGDKIALMHFDFETKVLLGFTSPSDRAALLEAVQGLRGFSGGTLMGHGLQQALSLVGTSGADSERILLLTDGNTTDEDLVRQVVTQLQQRHVGVVSVGLGADWNANLLNHIADSTRARVWHIVDDEQWAQDSSASEKASRLPEVLEDEMMRAAAEEITDAHAAISTVRGTELLRVTQVIPQVSEVALTGPVLSLGSLSSKESAVFLLEFRTAERSPCRARLAQVALTYRPAGWDVTMESSPQDLVVEFTTDEERAARINQAVIDYVGQRNLNDMLEEAARLAESEPAKAEALLRKADALARRVNPGLTMAVQSALGQMASGKTLSLSARKTLQVGAKTKTARVQGLAGMNDEDIRRRGGS